MAISPPPGCRCGGVAGAWPTGRRQIRPPRQWCPPTRCHRMSRGRTWRRLVPVPDRAPTASACEPYDQLTVDGLRRGRNAMGSWQDLVDGHGIAVIMMEAAAGRPGRPRALAGRAPIVLGQILLTVFFASPARILREPSSWTMRLTPVPIACKCNIRATSPGVCRGELYAARGPGKGVAKAVKMSTPIEIAHFFVQFHFSTDTRGDFRPSDSEEGSILHIAGGR